MDEAKFRAILHDELAKQREDIFRAMGDAIGYDLGDPEVLKDLRKDLWMIRSTRQRSERFRATGEKLFFVFFWGGVLTALGAGAISIIKSKIMGQP